MERLIGCPSTRLHHLVIPKPPLSFSNSPLDLTIIQETVVWCHIFCDSFFYRTKYPSNSPRQHFQVTLLTTYHLVVLTWKQDKSAFWYLPSPHPSAPPYHTTYMPPQWPDACNFSYCPQVHSSTVLLLSPPASFPNYIYPITYWDRKLFYLIYTEKRYTSGVEK